MITRREKLPYSKMGDCYLL